MTDRKSIRLNSSHADIYTLSLHDALPISEAYLLGERIRFVDVAPPHLMKVEVLLHKPRGRCNDRSEEHTSELQSRRYLHSFPTRRSSDLRSVLAWRANRIR